MVKGVRDDLDKIFKNRELPIIVETALLMYKDKIIYNSFFVEVPIIYGNDIKVAIMNDYDKAIRYYHL